MPENKRVTLSQERAKHAWESVGGLQKGGKFGEPEKKLLREARKLPARIISAGLGGSLAFLQAKAAKEESLMKLSGFLDDWIFNQRKFPPFKSASPNNPPGSLLSGSLLLESIIHGDSPFLMQATDEVLAYMQWFNRFADAAKED